ncbi:hypothetical protein NHN26_13165 [Rhodovulum tesquicola]|uniref:hypothetical protein n=1 Tax=Rhodovulum tesquicola TaxID=540254 RepID=UPI002097FA11|nr:hypothetical protein [Rhodovulum tesquicola]MCO8146171.1 hypothetical protein [Rhodovulum tesquicola]
MKLLKSVRPEDWPAVILRGAALVLIVSHLIAFFFIYSHFIFILTALVMGLLLAREMYEDLAQRFFRLKAQAYEKDLMERQDQTEPPGRDSLLIEGRPSMKDITDRVTRN